jgi:O-antigen/teichoic acid export membrane protein
MFTIGTGIVNRIISQFDYLIIGKLSGPHLLGVYTFAFIITNVLRGQIVFLLNKVMFPIYGRLQDNYEKAKDYYYKVIRFNAMIVYPVTTILILFSHDILDLLYGNKWIEAVPVIKVLSLSVFVSMTINSYNSFLRGTGKANLEFRTQVLKLVVMAPAMYFGYKWANVIGVAWGHFVATTFHTLIICFILTTRMGLSVKNIVRAISLPLLIAAVTFLAGTGLNYLNVPLVVSASIFLAFSFLLNYLAFKDEFRKIISLVKPRKPGTF